MKILHVTPSYFPATSWGGPIFSILGLNVAVSALPDIDLIVLSTDAFGKSIFSRHSGVTPRPSNYKLVLVRRVLGDSISPGMLFALPRLISHVDVVHLSAVYSFPTIPTLFFARLLRRPIVWSPHGSLLATATWRSVKHRRSKRVWEWICNLIVSRRNCVLHVTSELERDASITRLPKLRFEVIPWGVGRFDESARQWRPNGLLRLIYVGRLDPLKGIDLLLHAIGLLRGQSIQLKLYGSGSSVYLEKLKRLVLELGVADKVEFMGHVDGERKSRAFYEADVCIVPSHKENFCMVAAEALAHSVPVIASTGTPWSTVEEKKCGFWVNNSPKSLAEAIRRIDLLDLEDMGRRGRKWMREEFGWNQVAVRMVGLYEELINKQQLRNR